MGRFVDMKIRDWFDIGMWEWGDGMMGYDGWGISVGRRKYREGGGLLIFVEE